MRMSRSPQNGGFHSSTGGGPLARPSAPVIASSPNCPSFAMVCLDSGPWTEVRGHTHARLRERQSASERAGTQVVPVGCESAQNRLRVDGAHIASPALVSRLGAILIDTRITHKDKELANARCWRRRARKARR